MQLEKVEKRPGGKGSVTATRVGMERGYTGLLLSISCGVRIAPTRARPACRVPLSLIVAVPDACLFGSSDQSQDLAPRPGSSDWKLWAADPAADPTHPVKAAQSCLSLAEFCGRSWSLSHRPPTKTRPSDGPSCDAKSGTLMSVSLPLSENQSGQSVCSPFLPIIIP